MIERPATARPVAVEVAVALDDQPISGSRLIQDEEVEAGPAILGRRLMRRLALAGRPGNKQHEQRHRSDQRERDQPPITFQSHLDSSPRVASRFVSSTQMPFTTETRLLQFARSPRIPAAVAFWRKGDSEFPGPWRLQRPPDCQRSGECASVGSACIAIASSGKRWAM